MSDNISLKYLFDQQNLNTRQGRWLAFLSEYVFEIKHIKGKENKVADALRINENLNYIADVRNHKIELDNKFEDGVKMAQELSKFKRKSYKK